MELQQQNENQLAPWDHQQGIPHNIIIQFQSTKKETKVEPISKITNTRISFNLSKFLQKRRRKVPLSWDNKEENSPDRPDKEGPEGPGHSRRIQITNLQPEDLYINQTMRLKEVFPSYRVKKDKETTFYKPQRYHSIHSSKQQKSRPRIRRPLQTHKTDPRPLSRNLTSKAAIEQLLANGKSTQSNESLKRPLTDGEAQTLLQIQTTETSKCIPIFKKSTRTHKLERIIEMIEKKERERSMQGSKKTEQGGQSCLERCLKTRKQLSLNLPKIQFTELCH